MSAAAAAGGVLLEARPFRPFKSSEEYLYAMKEDLAEWLTVLYPELIITADNFLDRLDTGVALCRHANAVRESARLLLEKADSAESEEALSLARALRSRVPVSLLPAARPGTFFARDNLSNFIEWCRRALGVLECLLFETDDLCLRKNEKHVVLCLLEVARRGAVLGMPAPLLVLMERQIERELAGEEPPADHGALGLAPAGPQQQVVTNDLRSLDERVRDLLARCSCPTQFPMVRVSEGKYRIGDTKLLIFVRILRSHVMVRVGGGWDTLAHYLDKHDPCRCRAQHRAPLAARITRSQRPYAELSGATVLYERAEPASLPYAPYAPLAPRRAAAAEPPASLQYHAGYRPAYSEAPASLPYLGDLSSDARPRRSSSPERVPARTNKPPPPLAARLSPSRSIRTRSDSPGGGAGGAGGRKSASPEGERRTRGAGVVSSAHLVPSPHASRARSPRPASPAPPAAPPAESASDNGSEVSDEGYRSLGVATSAQGSPSAPARPLPTHRHSLHSQHSADDADYSERLDNDDGCETERVDEHVSLNTGLRKTDYSHTLYGGKKQPACAGAGERATPERVSTESNHSPSKSLRRHQPSRIPHSPVRARTPTRADTPSPKRAPPPAQTSPKSAPRLPPAARSTWSGRAAPGQARSKPRPTVAADTFDNPNKSPKSRVRAVAPAPAATEAFKRNSPLRASSATLRSTPSPNGKPLSPLLEQILRSTESAKDDASVLEKMKDIIRQYSSGNGGDSLSRSSSKDSDYADFTSAWVMSDGKLERSTSTRQLAAPRRDARATPSRIPAPLACRRSTSTTHFQ